MITYWQKSDLIRNRVYIPKYYDPDLRSEIGRLEKDYFLWSIGELIDRGSVLSTTGDEIGKMAYGTGNIPFVRTSDLANWEIVVSPKQGISRQIFERYLEKQDVQEDDILLVRDGTYLIGTNCLITALDLPFVYQSHLLKFRITKDKDQVEKELFFLALNCQIVRRQLRSVQFTADTIDTIGNRYKEVMIPVPRSEQRRRKLAGEVRGALRDRARGQAFVRQSRRIIGEAIGSGTTCKIEEFVERSDAELGRDLTRNTVAMEFGAFRHFSMSSDAIQQRIYLPKYYNPEIASELKALNGTCECVTIGELIEEEKLDVRTGDEVGKMAYGGGDIPFYRTSDFQSWELKHDPKQYVSTSLYLQFAKRQDLRAGDVLLVRDGTYLVGNVCFVSEYDVPGLYCGGIFRIRTLRSDELSPYLLLGLLSTSIVRQQMRAKQFTRDVIDTLGNRLYEIVLPIPKSHELRKQVDDFVERVLEQRLSSRQRLRELADAYGVN